jgi:hypothetical protein
MLNALCGDSWSIGIWSDLSLETDTRHRLLIGKLAMLKSDDIDPYSFLLLVTNDEIRKHWIRGMILANNPRRVAQMRLLYCLAVAVALSQPVVPFHGDLLVFFCTLFVLIMAPLVTTFTVIRVLPRRIMTFALR